MTQRPLLTRKDVALLTGMSIQWVARHESDLGLRAIRLRWKSRAVRYPRAQALALLADVGVPLDAG